MFQECLIVLRTIVMRSLGIASDNSPQKAESSRHLTEQINQIHSHDSSKIQSPKLVQIEKESKSSPTANSPASVAPRDKKSKMFMTPSPHSRISSGFGSLQEEDGVLNCESSYDNVREVKHTQDRGHQRDPNLIAIEQRSSERERKKRKRHKHHRHTKSHDTPSSNWQTDDKINTASPDYDEERDHSLEIHQRELNPAPPPPRTGAWFTPDSNHTTRQNTVIGLNVKDSQAQTREQFVERHHSSSNNQSHQQSPPSRVTVKAFDRNSTTANTHAAVVDIETSRGEEEMKSPRESKAFSPRAEKQRQKLHSKQIELLRSKEEKQRLANEVNLLNLKVLEEGTK